MRPLDPKSSALAKLSHTPFHQQHFIRDARYILYYKQQNVNPFFKFFLISEKIILNAKGSESLRTHYFFT